MNDLTRIKGIGKAAAKRLAAAGYASFAALAAVTIADRGKLQDAGFATVDIDRWVIEAAKLAADSSEGGNGPAANSTPPASADAGGSSSGPGEGPTGPDTPVGSESPQGTNSANTPEGSSGTARPRVEPTVSTRPSDPSTDGGTTAETPSVGVQPGSPHSDTKQPAKGGGSAPKPGAPAVPPGKRRFPVASPVMMDGVLHEAGGEPIALTAAQFAQLRAGGAVSGAWEDGEPA